MLFVGAGARLLTRAEIPADGGTGDPALIVDKDGKDKSSLARFIEAVAKHRNFARETDPPRV
jgi:catalase